MNAANPTFLQSVGNLNRDGTVWVSWQIIPCFSCDLHAWAGRASPRATSAEHASPTCSAPRATSPPKSLLSPKIEVPGYLGNEYQLLSPQPRDVHTLRIRAADTRVLQWGAWSQPVTFGRCPDPWLTSQIARILFFIFYASGTWSS